MNISWILHELTKEVNWIVQVESSDWEVDKTTNKFLMLSWLTLYGAIVGIKFEVLVERGCHKFALSYRKLA